jgi:hypothetical protein
MECRYCHYFQKGVIRRVKDKPNQRFCVPTDEWKNKDDMWCNDEFKMSANFWCDLFSCRLPIAVCIWRQRQLDKSYYRECSKCPQGEDIKYIVALRAKEEKPKPTLIKRNKKKLIKRKSKPQLIVRKKKTLIKRKK